MPDDPNSVRIRIATDVICQWGDGEGGRPRITRKQGGELSQKIMDTFDELRTMLKEWVR